jgi:glutathione-regulated potassium-efflux system protein KefB
MNDSSPEFGFLSLAVVLLATAVVTVPIARRMRLSAIVAYLAAGILIGPWGIGMFRAPETILGVAQLGIVLLLFVIGLELDISRLLALRRAIFGLGAAQFVSTAAAIAALAWLSGANGWRGAVIAGIALALSATAIALRILEERGHLQQTYGQRAFAILLFQDMAVVPILAVLPLLAPGSEKHPVAWLPELLGAGRVAAAILALVLAGRYLLNPLFRLLADTGAREVMTAAALLVVFGAALLMQVVGMSMALGAFLAGILLAGSNYRHELEADVEPFRGLLLALFFMGIGMTIDLAVVMHAFWFTMIGAVLITGVKAGIVALLFRATCSRRDALRAGSVLTGAGEFAFVLLPLGVSLGALTSLEGSVFTAIAAVTMLIGPPVAQVTEAVLGRVARPDSREPDDFDGTHSAVLLIGFGRFGQIVSQCLLAEGIDVTTLDNDAQMIQSAGRFGFKVYYGDGSRLDVLRAAGAGQVRLIAVCVDDRPAATRIVELVREQFPGIKLYVRSYDRTHSLDLIAKGVDYELRETYESAMTFGRNTLEALGLQPERAREVEDGVRARDLERLALQQAGGLLAGAELMRAPHPRPEPLTRPEREGTALNPEAEDILHHETEFSG